MHPDCSDTVAFALQTALTCTSLPLAFFLALGLEFFGFLIFAGYFVVQAESLGPVSAAGGLVAGCISPPEWRVARQRRVKIY